MGAQNTLQTLTMDSERFKLKIQTDLGPQTYSKLRLLLLLFKKLFGSMVCYIEFFVLILFKATVCHFFFLPQNIILMVP